MKPIVPNILTFISLVLVAGVIGGSVFLALLRLDLFLGLKQAEIKNQAIDGCASVSRNTFTTAAEGQTNVISDINQDPYQKCLELKNVQ